MVGFLGQRSSSTMISRRRTSQAQFGIDASNFCRLNEVIGTIVSFRVPWSPGYSSSLLQDIKFIYINLLSYKKADAYNTNLMEQVSQWIQLTDDESEELKMYDSKELIRMSEMVRTSLGNMNSSQLNFQEALHLEVQVEKVRDFIFQCNLELTDFIVSHVKDTHREGRLSEAKDNKQTQISQLEVSPEKALKVSPEKAVQMWEDHIKMTLQTFKKTLTVRQVQLTMVLFVVQHCEDINFPEIYLKNYGMLPSFMIPLEYTSRPINLNILDDLFRKEIEYLQIYHNQIQNLNRLSTLSNMEDIDRIIGRMKISHSKIKTIGEIFPWACIKDKTDLFSQDPCSPRWQRLTATGQIKYVSLTDRHTLISSFESIRNNITVVNAAMSVLDRHKVTSEESLTKKMVNILSTAAQVLRVAIFKSQAHHQASVMMAEPQQTLTKQIWNLPQSKKFRDFIQLSLPSIDYSEVLYLPRKLKNYFFSRYNQEKEIHFPIMHVDDLQQYWQDILRKQSYEDTIRVRINSPFKLIKRKDSSNQNQSGLLETWSKLFQKEKKVPKQVIFHIHGGGFISMSSFIHQTYTRQWASSLQVPIISVDYGKAPDRPFPLGLYDCLEAYIWTLTAFKQIYEVQPEKIIMVGDSAGGNLCAALINLLLLWNFPVPSGLVLIYPALNLNFQDYTPSLLTALNDMILPHTLLKLCLKAYLKDSKLQPEKDPLISPILVSPEALASYPRTQILVGNKDPFHDDCCRLIERINNAKEGNGVLTVFEQFPHGFLQFDLRLFPNEYAREATKIVESSIGKLLNI